MTRASGQPSPSRSRRTTSTQVISTGIRPAEATPHGAAPTVSGVVAWSAGGGTGTAAGASGRAGAATGAQLASTSAATTVFRTNIRMRIALSGVVKLANGRTATALTLGERHPALSRGPGVLGLRADEAVVTVLLHDVRAPPGHAADGEDRRAQVGRDPEVGVGRGGEEVDVHRELSAPVDLVDELLLDLEVRRGGVVGRARREGLRRRPRRNSTAVAAR